jgi:predicted aspartyl protease
VSVPRTGITIDVSFLVDTGAEISVLSARHALALGIMESDGLEISIAGSSGLSKQRAEIAVMQFLSGRNAYLYRIPIAVLSGDAEYALLPSLLGRDILNRWDMSYRPSRGRLSFDIVSADETLRIS